MILSTHEEFLVKLNNTFGDVYTVLESYINRSTKIKIMHKICGYVWQPTPSNLLKGKGSCPKCLKKIRYTTETYGEEVLEKTNGEYMLISEYKNISTKVYMKHLICGYEWKILPQAFQQGVRCPRCQGRERYTDEDFNNKVIDVTNGEYEFVGNYVNNYTKSLFVHKICKTSFEESPINFLYSNKRCPKEECSGHKMQSMSYGEKKIASYLDSNKINYVTQYSFEKCKHFKSLLFDFAILNKTDGSLLALIEFDGKQHFEPIEWFGGEEKFENQKIRDQIKNDYCIKNNINLLRIPYWDEMNVTSIMENFINSLQIN